MLIGILVFIYTQHLHNYLWGLLFLVFLFKKYELYDGFIFSASQMLAEFKFQRLFVVFVDNDFELVSMKYKV